MPGLDGIQATRAIRALPEGTRVPIIAVTADALQSTVDACHAVGMNDHLVKPVDPDTLKRVLMRWILGDVSTAGSAAQAITVAPDDVLPERLPGIDTARAAVWCGGSARTLAGLLDRVLAHDERYCRGLQQQIAAGNDVPAAEITHALVAIAPTVGATVLAGAASRLDREIREGRATSQAGREAVDIIATEFSRLQESRRILQDLLR